MNVPRVVVPYVNLHPFTRQTLDRYELDLNYVDVAGNDDRYRDLLRRLWLRGETVVIVEHDVVPWPGSLEELNACPALWCAHSYTWTNEHGRSGIGLAHMLGCAKLSTELMRALPDVWRDPCHWSECDRRLYGAAQAVGIEPHLHRPAVIHAKGMAA